MLSTEKEEIMRLVIKDRAVVRRLTITKKAIEIFNFCKEKGGALTRQVAEEFDIDAKTAATEMAKLRSLGYLSRYRLKDKSGGIKYIYYAEI